MKIGQNTRNQEINKNSGFSLVELIIIVALMGVVLWYGTPRVDSVFGYSAREANTKIYNSIVSFKTSYMGKARGSATYVRSGSSVNPDLTMYMEIFRNSKNRYFVKFHIDGEADVVEELAPNKIDISFQYKGGTTLEPVGEEGNGLILAFDRSTGGFLPQSISGGSPVHVKYIYCSSGTKTYKIELMPQTGKVMIDKD